MLLSNVSPTEPIELETGRKWMQVGVVVVVAVVFALPAITAD